MALEAKEVVSEVANHQLEPVVSASGQWGFPQFSRAGGPHPAIEDHTAGNEFGPLSAQPSARFH